MGKLITVIGNSGIGKTTLTEKLCDVGSFVPLLEKNVDRRYQKRFEEDLKGYALLNQIDFFLFRAEQEIFARENDLIGVQDGGLDQDYHVFSHCFHQKGYLNDEEFYICKRLYSTLRLCLPSPDLIIKLNAPTSILVERMVNRQREIDIIKADDLIDMEKLIDAWLAKDIPSPIINIDAREEDPSYSTVIDELLQEVNKTLKIK
jgi:deoxyadenosine/deoxycytidine kinase